MFVSFMTPSMVDESNESSITTCYDGDAMQAVAEARSEVARIAAAADERVRTSDRAGTPSHFPAFQRSEPFVFCCSSSSSVYVALRLIGLLTFRLVLSVMLC